MGFKCSLIGLPNVGKSTLFNALTKAGIEAANFPFCTIKPNTGVVPILDQRLNQLANIVKPQNIIPATVEFIDIAGLIKGASKGEGLGNQFLSYIRQTEAIGHVVRCFENDNILHVSGKINPTEDINIVNTELAMSDLEVCERAISRIHKHTKVSDKTNKLVLLVLEKCLQHLNNANVLRTLVLSNDEKNTIQYINFLTLKPTMYIANIDENGFINNHYLEQVKTIAKAEGSIVVMVCALIESDITKLNEEDRNEFIMELGFKETSLDRIIQNSYNLLNLQTYFTAGAKEVHAWTIPIGATAMQAAGKIHTDFQRGFIRAQTISFTDFITYKGEHSAKEAGKMRCEGKHYIVQDGDVINFLFHV